MKRIKQAWDWKPHPETTRTLKFRAVRALAGFLALMVCCTLISRAADSVTVPVVSTEKARRGNVVHRFTVSGMLEVSGGAAVMAPSAMPVTQVLVKEGDTVEQGDLLFVCDIGAASREIAAKQLDIKSIRMEMTIEDEAWERSQHSDVTALDRYAEDYEAVEQEYELRLLDAAERLRKARVNLQKYDGVRRWEYDESDFTELEYENFRSEFRSATIAYEQVEAEREKALREVERQAQDKSALSSDSSRELSALRLQKAELELSNLQRAVAGGGNVYAPSGGIITRMDIDVGKRTSEEAAAIITDPENLQFTAEITKEQRKYIQAGDLVALTLSGERIASGDMPVLSVVTAQDKSDVFLVTVEVPSDLAAPGRSADIAVARKSQQYDTCVPLSALYAVDEVNYYVLAVREVESVLGPEYRTERLDVTVLEKSDTTAAITGPVTPDTRIVTESGRPLREGDRVRLQNAQDSE